jgi:D-sedoheptulose 7-phosphate isomerase
MQDTSHRFVESFLSESLMAMTTFAQDSAFTQTLTGIAEAIVQAMTNGHKLLIAGNGGSAADAQHIAAEFISRLMFDRAALPAIALTTDTSALTAVGNDYGYDLVFDRQVQALGQCGDVFLAISTSGKSPNVLRALETARSRGLVTVGFTGSRECRLAEICDHVLSAPSTKTAIIQQIHIVAAHVVCSLVERAIFSTEACENNAESPEDAGYNGKFARR